MKESVAPEGIGTRVLGPGVVLQPLESWHANEFAEHMDRAREHIRPWVGPAFPTVGIEAARSKLVRYGENAARDGARLFGIWDHGVLVGGVLFVEFDADNGHCEVGCWLEPESERRGLVTRACRVLIEWAITVRKIHRVEWICRSGNQRSSAVAQRLGMSLEGVLRDAWKIGEEYFDKEVWAVLSHDWRENRE